jgi:hypothetical protein
MITASDFLHQLSVIYEKLGLTLETVTLIWITDYCWVHINIASVQEMEDALWFANFQAEKNVTSGLP